MVHMDVMCTIPTGFSDVHVESGWMQPQEGGESLEVSRSPGEAFTTKKCNNAAPCHDGTCPDIPAPYENKPCCSVRTMSAKTSILNPFTQVNNLTLLLLWRGRSPEKFSTAPECTSIEFKRYYTPLSLEPKHVQGDDAFTLAPLAALLIRPSKNLTTVSQPFLPLPALFLGKANQADRSLFFDKTSCLHVLLSFYQPKLSTHTPAHQESREVSR